MSSHVFFVHGSIMHLSCDFIGISAMNWLFRSHANTKYTHLKWLDDDQIQSRIQWENGRFYDERPKGATMYLDFLEGIVPESVPKIFLLHGERFRDRDLEWFVKTVEEYLVKVNEYIVKNIIQPKNRRDRILVALPFIGIRYLGGDYISGGIIKGIIDKVYQFSNDLVDYALVTLDEFAYKAALSYRNSIPMKIAFPELIGTNLQIQMKELAKHAREHNLAIFLGAGCSIPAGLPTWGKLLTKLADDAGLNDTEKKYLNKLSFLDQARIIEQRLGGNDFLTKSIAEDMNIDFYSMQHCFLQSLSCNQIITTNYDILYEKCCETVDKPLLVLPYSPKQSGDYLLKLHGCIRHPEDIVLTREDYISYNDKKQALSGIVQSSMLTKHMMFIGFSLEDDNFHSIASTVKKAQSNSIIGTSFQIIQSPLLEELWTDRLTFINMKPPILDPQGSDWSEGGRLLEISLDYLLQKTYDSHHHYLLDDNYSSLLSEKELVFGSLINEVMFRAEELGVQNINAFLKFNQILKHNFGYKKEFPIRERHPGIVKKKTKKKKKTPTKAKDSNQIIRDHVAKIYEEETIDLEADVKALMEIEYDLNDPTDESSSDTDYTTLAEFFSFQSDFTDIVDYIIDETLLENGDLVTNSNPEIETDPSPESLVVENNIELITSDLEELSELPLQAELSETYPEFELEIIQDTTDVTENAESQALDHTESELIIETIVTEPINKEPVNPSSEPTIQTSEDLCSEPDSPTDTPQQELPNPSTQQNK